MTTATTNSEARDPGPEPPRPGLLPPGATPEEREAWRGAARAHAVWVMRMRRNLLVDARARFAAGEVPAPEEVRDLLGLLCTLALEQLDRGPAAQQQFTLPPQLAQALPAMLPALMGALGGAGKAGGG